MNVDIKFPREKMRALQLFIELKGLSYADELTQAAEALYQKHVPSSVKTFLASKEKTKDDQPDSSASAVE